MNEIPGSVLKTTYLSLTFGFLSETEMDPFPMEEIHIGRDGQAFALRTAKQLLIASCYFYRLVPEMRRTGSK
jgi:hypothetical protein